MTAEIDIRDLTKTYRTRTGSEVHALKGVSLSVERGSIFGLLGPNGAGKSTIINILAGTVDKTSGSVCVGGYDQATDMIAAKRSIGIVPQELAMDPFFTPEQTLDLHAGYFGIPKRERRTEELLRAFGLWDKRAAYSRNLSGGMKRRLMTCKALVHSPGILVLDEPTAGVDIELRHRLWTYVRQLNADGVTIVLTTHYLEEAQELCDRIAILNHGEIVAEDSQADLLARFGARKLRVTVSEPFEALPADLAALDAVTASGGLELLFDFERGTATLAEIIAAVTASGRRVSDVSSSAPDLSDVFLQLTGDSTPAENNGSPA